MNESNLDQRLRDLDLALGPEPAGLRATLRREFERRFETSEASEAPGPRWRTLLIPLAVAASVVLCATWALRPVTDSRDVGEVAVISAADAAMVVAQTEALERSRRDWQRSSIALLLAKEKALRGRLQTSLRRGEAGAHVEGGEQESEPPAESISDVIAAPLRRPIYSRREQIAFTRIGVLAQTDARALGREHWLHRLRELSQEYPDLSPGVWAGDQIARWEADPSWGPGTEYPNPWRMEQ